jgi:flagellar basal-body rod protein FlgC
MSQLFSSLKISGSGLHVFRHKMNVAAENMANAETTKTKAGGPYQRKTLIISGREVPTSFSGTLARASVKMAQTKPGHLPANIRSPIQATEVCRAESQEQTNPDQGVRLIYDPAHPDADAEGFVAMPDIDPLVEMVNMMTAARAYEANITAIQAVKDMAKKAMDI